MPELQVMATNPGSPSKGLSPSVSASKSLPATSDRLAASVEAERSSSLASAMHFAGHQAYIVSVAKMCRDMEVFTDVKILCADGELAAHRWYWMQIVKTFGLVTRGCWLQIGLGILQQFPWRSFPYPASRASWVHPHHAKHSKARRGNTSRFSLHSKWCYRYIKGQIFTIGFPGKDEDSSGINPWSPTISSHPSNRSRQCQSGINWRFQANQTDTDQNYIHDESTPKHILVSSF